jgi:hypothetical protein
MHRVATLALFVAACSEEGVTSESLEMEPRLSSIQTHVFTPSCANFSPCHDSSSPAGALELTEGASFDQLVSREATMDPARMLVVPGDPDGSFLVQKLRDGLDESLGVRMPFGNPPLPDAEIVVIEEWIARGATND